MAFSTLVETTENEGVDGTGGLNPTNSVMVHVLVEKQEHSRARPC